MAPQALGQLSDLVQLLQVEIQAAHLPNNAMIISEDTRVTPQRPAGSEIVFHDQAAPSDRIEPGMAQRRVADDVGSGNALMHIHPRKMRTMMDGVLLVRVLR